MNRQDRKVRHACFAVLAVSLFVSTGIAAGTGSCDLNRDGRIDVLDLSAGIQSIFGRGTLLDLNCDGQAAAADLQLLVNAVLGGNCPAACPLALPALPALHLGHADLRVAFTPNPVADNGTGRFLFDASLVETNGVAVTLTSLVLGEEAVNRIDQLTSARRIEGGGNLSKTFVYALPAPLTRMQDLSWELRGYDEQGHGDLVWRSSIRLVPFSGGRYGHLAVFFEPQPAAPDDTGAGANLLVARETNDVGITLTGLTVNGADYSGYILDARIPPRGSAGARIGFPPEAAPGEYRYVFQGRDDNGHTGLTWSAVNRRLDYVQLLGGIPREHQALNSGYAPYQFRVYVPEGSTSLTVRLDGPASPENLLGLYGRGGSPVTGLENPFPPNPKADFALTGLGNGSMRIDAASSPSLQTGVSYFLVIHRASGARPLSFTLTATIDNAR